MFILRIIEESRELTSQPFHQAISNIELGETYTLFKKDKSTKFNELVEKNNLNKDSLRAIIKSGDILHLIRVNTEFNSFSYFIMNENGTTFEKL